VNKSVVCCVNNLQQFQYGAVLQELVDLGFQVRLDRCQSLCVGCRRQPAAVVEGKWKGFDAAEQLRQYVLEEVY
jgi:uncharacterized protein YuzB (UPF0349 family)